MAFGYRNFADLEQRWIKATFEGLRSLKDPQEVARLREKPLEEILG